MGRWYFNFKIFFNRKTFRDLASTDPLRKMLEVIRDTALKVFVSDGLNKAYDWRFPQLCEGTELDIWGETLNLPRNPGESDADYRIRVVNEYTDILNTLSIHAIKNSLNPIIGEDPEVITCWFLAADWPFEWWQDNPNFQSWTPWEQLVDFLVIVPEDLTQSQLNQIETALLNVKWAVSRALVVEDKTTYYFLKKEVL